MAVVFTQKELIKVFSQGNSVLPRNHPEVKAIDRQLAKMFVSSSVSLNLLENKDFSNFAKKHLNGPI